MHDQRLKFASQSSERDLKYCPHERSVVGAGYWIPDAQFDCNESQSWYPTVGCNNVYCNHCKEFVRQRSDYDMGPHSGTDERTWAPILFATDDWSTLGFLKPATIRVSRIYYCKCFCCTQSSYMPLDGSGDHLIYGASYCTDWHCHGHPPLTVPTAVYGVRLAKPADAKAVVMAVMAHRAVIRDLLPDREVDPEAFLINRFYGHLHAAAFRRPIDTLMASFLAHPDSLCRSVACVHLEKFPASAAARTLVKAYRTQPALFDGVPHPHHERGIYPDMRSRVVGLGPQFQRALLAYLKYSKSRTARALLRELILAGIMQAWWGSFRQDIGVAWINAHCREIYSADPRRSIPALLEAGDATDDSRDIARAQELMQMKLLPEKVFLDAVPRGIKEALLRAR